MEILSPTSLSQAAQAHNHHTAVGSTCKKRECLWDGTVCPNSLFYSTHGGEIPLQDMFCLLFSLLILGISLHWGQGSSFGNDTSFLNFQTEIIVSDAAVNMYESQYSLPPVLFTSCSSRDHLWKHWWNTLEEISRGKTAANGQWIPGGVPPFDIHDYGCFMRRVIMFT